MAYLGTYSKPHEFLVSSDALSVVSYPVIESRDGGRKLLRSITDFERVPAVEAPQRCTPNALK